MLWAFAEFATSSSSLRTTRGNAAICAGRKKQETALSAKTMPYRGYRPPGSANNEASAARTRWLAIMVALRFQRSTNTPAIGPTRATGST